jgi:hypothetical protein
LSDARWLRMLCLGSVRDAADFAARATPLARATSNRFERMINSGNLGLAALLNGDTDAAAHAFHEELSLCREMVVRPPWRSKAYEASPAWRWWTATTVAPQHLSARRRRAATTRPSIRSGSGSIRGSSSPPAHGTARVPGTQPPLT